MEGERSSRLGAVATDVAPSGSDLARTVLFIAVEPKIRAEATTRPGLARILGQEAEHAHRDGAVHLAPDELS
jgi:hypothetical protein